MSGATWKIKGTLGYDHKTIWKEVYRMSTLTDREKIYLFDTMQKLARWEPVGLAGGGYWSIRIWSTKPLQTLDESLIEAHNEQQRKEMDDGGN